MTTFIDDTGYHRTRLDEYLATLTAQFKDTYGDDIDVSPSSPDGQWLGTLAEAFADFDELLEAVYNGRSAAGARGAALARLSLLNGVIKKPASFATVPVTLSGTPGTFVPTGALIATDNSTPPDIFQTTADLTIGGGGTITGIARASVSGPAARAALGHLTVIQTVIAGWTSVTSTADATPGSDTETDPALRIRRRASVALPSQGILDGLFAALSQLTGVQHAIVYENSESTPKTLKGGETLGGHSIRALVDGGDPVAIANALWTKKSGGVTQVGTTSQDITDAQGQTQTQRWDAPVGVPAYVTVTLSAAAGTLTKTAIKTALVEYGVSNSGIATDVEWFKLSIPINSVPGLHVVSVFLDRAPAPTLQQDLVINADEIARWDLSQIIVNP